MDIVVSPLRPRAERVEIVEHKGIGHPDTICDALAEELSERLSRWYLERYGCVFHHNVDKALLCGGASDARFGGGDVTQPIDIFLAGRATTTIGAERVPLEEIAIAGSHDWLRRNLHALDPERHVRIHPHVREGSAELTALFARGRATGASLANDTSCGVGFAPLSRLERVVLACANHLRKMAADAASPHIGEDVKVMGTRTDDALRLTVACAFVAAHLRSIDAYADARAQLAADLTRVASEAAGRDVSLVVNAADDLAASRVYLTVTGTSAEAGDDGQVGRGNRTNRLITPCRPMTLEAAAGKNPITHVGKLYSVTASRIASALVEDAPGVLEAECFLVSEIGRRIDDPPIAEVRVRTEDGSLPAPVARAVEEIAREGIQRVGSLWKAIVAGKVTLF